MKYLFIITILFAVACSSEESDPQPVEPTKPKQLVATPVDSAFTVEVPIKEDTTGPTRFDVGLFVDWHMYYVARFYREAKQYGWGELQRNNLIVATHITDTPQPCRSYVNSSNQLIIQINSHLTMDQAFIPFYRLLAHHLLGKPYTETDDIMNPEFSKYFTARNFDEKVARPYLDRLFKK